MGRAWMSHARREKSGSMDPSLLFVKGKEIKRTSSQSDAASYCRHGVKATSLKNSPWQKHSSIPEKKHPGLDWMTTHGHCIGHGTLE